MRWLKGNSDLQIVKRMIDVKKNSLTILFF